MYANEAFHSCPEATSAWSAPLRAAGACFQLSTQPWKKERDGLARVTHPADTESSQHRCAGGAKSLSPQSVKLGSPSPRPPLTPPAAVSLLGRNRRPGPRSRILAGGPWGGLAHGLRSCTFLGLPHLPFPGLGTAHPSLQGLPFPH